MDKYRRFQSICLLRPAFDLTKYVLPAATFQNAAKTKLESSLDVQTRIQFGHVSTITTLY